jgi:hypothetical protein
MLKDYPLIVDFLLRQSVHVHWFFNSNIEALTSFSKDLALLANSAKPHLGDAIDTLALTGVHLAHRVVASIDPSSDVSWQHHEAVGQVIDDKLLYASWIFYDGYNGNINFPHRTWYRGAFCAAGVLPAFSFFGLAVWSWRLLHKRVLRYRLASCSGQHAKLGRYVTRWGGVSMRATALFQTCRPSYFTRIGPSLPYHTPSCNSPCSHSLCAGVHTRMMKRLPEQFTDLPRRTAEKEVYDWAFSDVDNSELHWCWDEFLANKPAKLKARAQRGLDNLLRSGAKIVSTPNGKHLLLVSALIKAAVSLFVKREFYDRNELRDKESWSPRIISNCSDEVLAFLGPYCWDAEHKLHQIPGMCKFVPASQLSPQIQKIVAQARNWRKAVVGYDMSRYDRHQLFHHMDMQHECYRRIGMPAHVLAFLKTYDIKWSGSSRGRLRCGKRRTCLRFTSSDGQRKTGDPHTSLGNNLFHWFLLMWVLYSRKIAKTDVLFCLNGDDFIGTFKTLTLSNLLKEYYDRGFEAERSGNMEFCGGFYMGRSCTFVRDVNRSLYKLGWNINKLREDEVDPMMKATLACQTYITHSNPILSSYISAGLQTLQFTKARKLLPRDIADVSYGLSSHKINLDLGDPDFSTTVPFDVRIAYSQQFHISPGNQMAFERQAFKVWASGEMPILLGRLV